MVITLASLKETQKFAAYFADHTAPGDFFALSGLLGAGKSTFARFFIRRASLNNRLVVPSPTYTLLQSYATPKGHIHHFDFWRLDYFSDEFKLEFDELVKDICIAEWAPKFLPYLPAKTIFITFAAISEVQRSVEVIGASPECYKDLGNIFLQ